MALQSAKGTVNKIRKEIIYWRMVVMKKLEKEACIQRRDKR